MFIDSKGWWWEKLRFSGGPVKNESADLNFSAPAVLVFLFRGSAVLFRWAGLCSAVGTLELNGNIWKSCLVAAPSADLIVLLVGGGCGCRQVKAACLCPVKHILPVFPQGTGCSSYMDQNGTNIENSWLRGFIMMSWNHMWPWWQSLLTWCW